MVLQFAKDTDLRSYLKKKQKKGLYKISWSEIIKLAGEITHGLKYLHDKKIIHRDLHSKNILIDDGNALIADFGMSKYLNESATLSPGGVTGLAYTDPRCFQRIKPDEKSDVYSLGLLFWELTSGIPPFSNLYVAAIISEVLKGEGEKIIENTPLEYVSLYSKCWSSNSADRPTLNEILYELEKLSTQISIEHITNKLVKNSYSYEESENCWFI
ncbi:kinase-like domain-containing protein [Gigaspora rosea]|uniref:Kinase-like domain-containing protein n=1 Tax=Gigaspora rosea TaxID=44941 RepID=A0A397W1Y6_9GLOM|nr:kinase-like domain-containing protein [Gigaspora rosea]